MVRHHPVARSEVAVDGVDVVVQTRHPPVPRTPSAARASVAENAAIVRVTVPDTMRRRLVAGAPDKQGLRR
jgi:hypothetical protein